ncbi:MAG: hypothetical protein E5Y31_09740 [Mesorhizobium sp.]|nr:MAG: hypothetical protein E5Y31_09740 [Mesorhizobium sp.]
MNLNSFGRALRCVEIQVRPSRKWWLPRTGAERTFGYVSSVLPRRGRTRKRRYQPFAGWPHLNIDAPNPDRTAR